MYYASFRSRVCYGVIFWGNYSDSSRLFEMQKKELRLITKSDFDESCRNRFKDLNILPLPPDYSYLFSSILFVFTNLEIFYSRHYQHPHFTRNSSVVYYPNHCTSFLKELLSILAIPSLIVCQTILKMWSRGRCLGINFTVLYLSFIHCFYSVQE